MKLKEMLGKLLYQNESEYVIEFDTVNLFDDERRAASSFNHFFKIIRSLKLDTMIDKILCYRNDIYELYEGKDNKSYLVEEVLEIIDELEQEHPHLFI